MRVLKLPTNPGNGIALVKFLPDEEAFKYIERSFTANSQFDGYEFIVAEVVYLGVDTEKFNLHIGEKMLLYTKSLLEQRKLIYKDEVYYLAHLHNSMVTSFGKEQ